MGDFSRLPEDVLADAVAKHYVGARIQQGVPVLDADVNLFGDLAANNADTMGRWFIGDGVPSGSDGFGIFPTGNNDFGIRKGICLVGGKVVSNEADVTYATQAHFADLALPALATPAGDKTLTAYLDLWEREVDSAEDEDIADGRIGIETSVRVKREWAVRVAALPEDLATLENPAPGHFHYPLADLRRVAAQPAITALMILDLRDTQVSVKKKIDLRDASDTVVVDNDRFRLMMQNTRNNVQAFLQYVATQFNHADLTLTFAETLGFQAASRLIQVAEDGLALVDAEALGNRAALRSLSQLYAAENNFTAVWRDVVLQLGLVVKKYATYGFFVGQLDEYLNQPLIGSLKGLLAALNDKDLAGATQTQEFIATLFAGAAANVPRGTLQISLVNVPVGNLTLGQIARFQFNVRSNTTLSDTYSVKFLPVGTWPEKLVDSSGIPIPGGKVNIGPSGTDTSLLIDVTVQAGSTPLRIQVTSDSNPSEITQLSSLYTLTVNQPPPAAENKVQFQIVALSDATLDSQGKINVAAGATGFVDVRVFNMTDNAGTFTLSLTDHNLVGTAWTRDFSAPPPTLTIPAHGSDVKQIGVAPAGGSVSFDLALAATATILGSTVSGSTTLQFKKV